MSNVNRQIKYTCDSIKGNQNLHSINSIGVGDIIKLLKIDLFCRDLTLANCAGEAQHFGKNEDLESSRTPECSELNSKAQNTSH
jgi:hypothetical protein